jgi:hypothetical protein
MSLRLGFDVDGVLADFKSGFEALASAHDVHGPGAAARSPDQTRTLTPADLKRLWDRIAATANWWTTLEPFEPDAIARLYALSREHRWEVVFLTKRPPSAGESVQFQTQWWLERHGFLLPAVVTVPGSRGELANALRLDLVVDDQLVNCVEVVSASGAKAVLMARGEEEQALRDHATSRGIGVVSNLAETIRVIERLQDILPARKGRLVRLMDWFTPSEPAPPSGDRLDTRTTSAVRKLE